MCCSHLLDGHFHHCLMISVTLPRTISSLACRWPVIIPSIYVDHGPDKCPRCDSNTVDDYPHSFHLLTSTSASSTVALSAMTDALVLPNYHDHHSYHTGFYLYHSGLIFCLLLWGLLLEWLLSEPFAFLTA